MRSVIVYINKELTEGIRTYRLFVLVVVFVIFGFMSPLTAKFMPEILSDMMPAGIEVNLPPASVDSVWEQFFKNITQICIPVIIILFFGGMTKEYEQGTLTNLLTKGIKHNTIIAGKFISNILQVTFSYWVSFSISLIYALYYFGLMGQDKLFLAAVLQNYFLIMLLAVILLFSSCSKNGSISLLITGCFMLILIVISLFSAIAKYNPLVLVSNSSLIMKGDIPITDLIWPIAATTVIIAVSLILSNSFFKRKDI